MIALKEVQKRYGETDVLSNVSFRIDPKEFVCMTGPSGAGKSTLIHLLVGAEAPTSGHIEVDGVDLRKVPPPAMQVFRRRVGVIFQDYKLLWNRTVAENIALPIKICGASQKVMHQRVEEVLEQMGLTHRAQTLARALSGGEKARTAIARAVVHSPIIILADEPTGNLDPQQSEDVLDIFKKIHAAGSTVILATHDTALVDLLHTRVIRIENGTVTRDNVGGYVGVNAVQNAKHDVFVDETIENTSPSEKTDTKKSVKITSINGNADA